MNIEKLKQATELSAAISQLQDLITNWEQATCFHPAFRLKLCDDDFNTGPTIDMMNFNDCFFKAIKKHQIKELNKQLATAQELFDNL